MNKMEQEFGKYSIGHSIYCFFDDIHIDLDSLTNKAESALKIDNFDRRCTIPYKLSGGRVMIISPLSESHFVAEYDPNLKKLFAMIYTCRDEFDGRKTMDSLASLIGVRPTKRIEHSEIVNPKLSEARKEQLHSSIDDALKEMTYDPDKKLYVSTIYSRIPKEKFDENSDSPLVKGLEKTLTIASNLNSELPDEEFWKRFKPGLTVLYMIGEGSKENVEDVSVLGAHSFGEYSSLHYGGWGKANKIIPRMKYLGELLSAKNFVVKVMQEDEELREAA